MDFHHRRKIYPKKSTPPPNLVDVSDIFYFFSARGRGRGSPGRRGGFLLKIPWKGGSPKGGGGLREGVCWELGGGGAKYFFWGAEMSTKKKKHFSFWFLSSCSFLLVPFLLVPFLLLPFLLVPFLLLSFFFLALGGFILDLGVFLGSWLVSQGRSEKFTRTFRKSSRKRGVFLLYFGIWGRVWASILIHLDRIQSISISFS